MQKAADLWELARCNGFLSVLIAAPEGDGAIVNFLILCFVLSGGGVWSIQACSGLHGQFRPHMRLKGTVAIASEVLLLNEYDGILVYG